MTANAFYREMQSLGMGARRAETLALFRVAKSIVARGQEEPFQDINEVPTGDQITPWPTRKAEGYMQTVTLAYREKETGQISTTFYSVKSDAPVSREEVLARAVNAYSDHADEYNQDLIGAIHTSAYRLVPDTED